MTEDLLSRADMRHCLAVAEASQSNLWLVGRLLTPPRRAFFAASYASMRVIDDFVDDGFLQGSPEQRRADRPQALETIDSWEAGIEQASQGGAVTGNPFDERIFSALSVTLGNSDLSNAPWSRMATAMRHDVNEDPFTVWQDFLDYCEGATVAPASIFLYVLAMQQDSTGRFGSGLPEAGTDPAPVARDMGIFCYLVHILRDLRKDAEQGESLLTIPQDILSSHGLRRDSLAEGARAGQADCLVGLVEDLAARAVGYRERAGQARSSLNGCLGKPEALVLDGLLSVYYGLHDRVLKDPAGVIQRPEGFGDTVRRKILSAAGLSV